MLATVNSSDNILLLSTATIKVLPLFESSNKQHMVPVLENDLLVLFSFYRVVYFSKLTDGQWM